MDDSDGFCYQEANHCKVRTITSGYGTYSDRGCHNYINSCDFDVASMAGILEGEANLTSKIRRRSVAPISPFSVADPVA